MLVIRFQKIGKKNQPFLRLVLAEKTWPPKGKYIEKLGSLDPRTKKGDIKVDRIKYWTEKGAKVSDSAWNFLLKEKAIKGEKRKIKLSEKKKKDKKEKSISEEKKEEKKEALNENLKEK